MEKLLIPQTETTPEVYFSPAENQFRISGTSRPEDVRAMYYPVTEWISRYANDVINKTRAFFSNGEALKFTIDLKYFNSSSAKFLYDIFTELKRLPEAGFPVIVEWYYEEEDTDMLDAGNDISELVNMKFTYIEKNAD